MEAANGLSPRLESRQFAKRQDKGIEFDREDQRTHGLRPEMKEA